MSRTSNQPPLWFESASFFRRFLTLAASLISLFSLVQIDGQARDFRTSMYPNGQQISCRACHVSQFGGGTRTAFGQAVFNVVRGSSRTAFWSPTLAGLDSDGDGFTNGQEVGDPDGDGIPDAGASVTNPGDRNSKPAVNLPPTVSLSEPAPGIELPAGSPVVLKAAAADSDGSVAQVEFFDGASSLGIVTAAPFELTVTLPPGAHSLTVKATDNQGASATSAAVSLVVAEAAPLRITSIQRAGEEYSIVWTGGVGPFRLLTSALLTPDSWSGDGSIAERTARIPASPGLGFFRIQDLGR